MLLTKPLTTTNLFPRHQEGEVKLTFDRAMVFRYDAALDLVFKEEFTEQPEDQEGEENAQQPQQQQEAVMNEPRGSDLDMATMNFSSQKVRRKSESENQRNQRK